MLDLVNTFRLAVTMISSLGLLLGLCACTSPLESPEWTQFQGDPSNSGFKLVRSREIPELLWTTEPYTTTSATPVVATDSTGREVIYIGTSGGELLAINGNDGSEKWRFVGGELGAITAAAAVSDRKDVYFIATKRPDHPPESSILRKVDEFGAIKWTFIFPSNAVSMSSPKVVRFGGDTLILVYVTALIPTRGNLFYRQQLFVIRDRDNSAQLLDRKGLGTICSPLVTGSDILGDIGSFLKDLWDVYTTVPSTFDASGASGTGRIILEPSVAISTQGQRLMISIADNHCNAGVFEWNGVSLTVVWSNGHNFQIHSSSIITGNNLMVFGRNKREESGSTYVELGEGQVLAFDISSGAKVWEYDVGESVIATPAAAPGQFLFVVSACHIRVLKQSDGTPVSDGGTIREQVLNGCTASSPAVSSNKVHVATGQLNLFNYSLTSISHVTSFAGNRLSSLALGKNGEIFAVRFDGRLAKYAGILK
jgi:outer membrane protein assembly factor BamB